MEAIRSGLKNPLAFHVLCTRVRLLKAKLSYIARLKGKKGR